MPLLDVGFQKAGRMALRWLLPAAAFGYAITAQAQLKLMIASDPNERLGRASQVTQIDSNLETLLGQPVITTSSTDFANVLRATRTGEYDIFIAPAQVAASALNYGYQVLASGGERGTFVMVGAPTLQSLADLRGKRVYLPHQDSLFSYLAKGMVNESGNALSASKVEYQRTAEAGLVALQMGVADATVARRSQFDSWSKSNPGVAKVLATSPAVPIGTVLVVKKDLSEPLRARILQWAVSGGLESAGQGRLKPVADIAPYRYLAGLGHFTPAALAGVERIDAAATQRLMAQGAQLVDVRTANEYKAKRIPGAVLASYIEKSVKEATYVASLDDFSAADSLDKSKPSIFACNGAECWKSYKASQQAIARGFKKVYWLRGGLPEWEAAGLPVTKE